MAPPRRKFSTVAGHSTSVWVCLETDVFVGINTYEDSMKDHLEACRAERLPGRCGRVNDTRAMGATTAEVFGDASAADGF